MDKKYTMSIFLTTYTRGVFHSPQLSKPNMNVAFVSHLLKNLF